MFHYCSHHYYCYILSCVNDFPSIAMCDVSLSLYIVELHFANANPNIDSGVHCWLNV